MITSHDNQHLKEIRRLRGRSSRARSGRFVAEGEDLIAAAHEAGIEPVFALRPAGASVGDERWLEADEALLRSSSVLAQGSRAIAVYEQRWEDPCGPLCVYLHGVRDPGNVGTIIRSLHAFGGNCIAVGPDCADPYGPKAVRASMGAIFAVRLARAARLGDLPGELIALDAHASEPLRGPLAGPATLLVGAERTGLPADVLGAAARRCAIPLAAGDSLNAAMAATVALYELTRVPAK
jgi:TrmH family RNA methyltransferase